MMTIPGWMTIFHLIAIGPKMTRITTIGTNPNKTANFLYLNKYKKLNRIKDNILQFVVQISLNLDRKERVSLWYD